MDVFIALLTSFGESLCYTCLPSVFNIFRSVKKTSIVGLTLASQCLVQWRAPVFISATLATATFHSSGYDIGNKLDVLHDGVWERDHHHACSTDCTHAQGIQYRTLHTFQRLPEQKKQD